MISLAFTESISSFRLAFKRSRCRGKFFATIKHVDPIYICSPVLLNTSSSPCRLPGVPPGLYAKVRMVFGSSTLDQGHPGLMLLSWQSWKASVNPLACQLPLLGAEAGGACSALHRREARTVLDPDSPRPLGSHKVTPHPAAILRVHWTSREGHSADTWTSDGDFFAFCGYIYF